LPTPRRIDFVAPSIIALAVMSAAFTGLAIGTGFERKYAVLKRLGATALPRSVLLLGKTLSVLLLELLQVVLISALAFALAWHPHGNPLLVVLLFGGGIAIPLGKFGSPARDILQYLPSAALSDGLRAVTIHGAGIPGRDLLTLLVWTAVALPAAIRWFRWE
jgi:ABC-2 type transport system permease protein